MKFARSAEQFRLLKAQFDAGRLSEADFRAKLQDLMVQDEQGRWWMIGYETGQWYIHDGEKWVQRNPPPVAEAGAQVTEASQPMAPAQPVTPPPAPARRRWVWMVAGGVGLIGLILLIVLLRSCTVPGTEPGPGPGVEFWADRDVIRPGTCTVLHWRVHGAEQVRIVGPNFDPQEPLPAVGEKEICLEGPAAYRLLSPDGQALATAEIQVLN